VASVLPSLSTIPPTISISITPSNQFLNFTPYSNTRVDVKTLKASSNAISLIKHFEGIVLQKYIKGDLKLKDSLSYPYWDEYGKVWTIGYGTTRIDGKSVTPSTRPITEAVASLYVERAINKSFTPEIRKYVKVPLNQNEFDALVVFTYNLGAGNLASSGLLRKINNKQYIEAGSEFLKWTYAGGKQLPGLVSRRANERYLYDLNSPGNK
jgi:lysozyme